MMLKRPVILVVHVGNVAHPICIGRNQLILLGGWECFFGGFYFLLKIELLVSFETLKTFGV